MKRQVGKSMDDREAVRIGDTRPDLPDPTKQSFPDGAV